MYKNTTYVEYVYTSIRISTLHKKKKIYFEKNLKDMSWNRHEFFDVKGYDDAGDSNFVFDTLPASEITCAITRVRKSSS